MCLRCPNYDLCDTCWDNMMETPPHTDLHETKMFRRPLKAGEAQQIFHAAQVESPTSPPIPVCDSCGSESPDHTLLECQGRPEQSTRELVDLALLPTTANAARVGKNHPGRNGCVYHLLSL